MAAARMHADEVDTDAELVRRLLEEQFPAWGGLAIARVEHSGTDNAIYRLGDDKAVRLPRREGAKAQVRKDERWLPLLAPRLPLAVPAPLATGVPGQGYPFHWSVCPWLEGESATLDRLEDAHEAARTLAGFVRALQAIDTSGGPAPGRHNFFRGVALAARDPWTRAGLAKLDDLIDVGAATAAWEAALRVPVWEDAPVWVHGDLQAGNLLATRGRITAVIDWGGLGVGDPAIEAIVAWNLLPAPARATFRAELGVDDATWARGRGAALSIALVALPYYRDTNPAIVASSLATLEAVIADD